MPELLQDWVAVRAERRPDAPALSLDGEAMSYADLETLSTQIAVALTEAGCMRGDRVCLLMDKNVLAVAALLGIYKADCIYVPLDPAGPTRRLGQVVNSCRPRMMLAGGKAGESVDAVLDAVGEAGEEPRIGWLDPAGPGRGGRRAAFQLAEVSALPPSSPRRRNGSSDPAHILLTSGSTGLPKGVVISHQNVITFIEWAVSHFRIQPHERLSQHPPLHFDLSIFDIFGAFAAGAQVRIVPELDLCDPRKLAAWIKSNGVTQWFSVPSLLNYMAKFEAVGFNEFPELKRVLWCGEVFPTPSLRHWMKCLPHVSFTNLYGPTETTIASTYYDVPRCPSSDTEQVPIGRACAQEQAVILDRHGQPARLGQVGELHIGGAGVSPGYWNDPGSTEAAFVHYTDEHGLRRRLYKTGDLAKGDPDGNIYFVGRADSQVKSRGYRVELGEVETALNALHLLRESAVVAIPGNGFEGTVICCAYAPNSDLQVNLARIREALRQLLPDYMIPTRWAEFEALPKNRSGKIDRSRLKEMWQYDGVNTPQYGNFG